MVERGNDQGLPQVAGPYVDATKHNKTFYISGLTVYGTKDQSFDMSGQRSDILGQESAILEYERRSKID
ncbi:hypothetical protein [Agarivorans sp. QJM3NY_33]|uniref:hypothetical protein n=1 Tax=Agarivorans sp. QJM3NY_33 TaxID=3421432 RepID=UPI003D7E8064